MKPMDQMLPHERRVVDEKNELDVRIEKLDIFIGSDTYLKLPNEEARRLDLQLDLMNAYSRVLGMRIEAFPVPYDPMPFTVVINGNEITFPEDGITHEQLVRAAYPNRNDVTGVSVVYEEKDGRGGSLATGESMRLSQGMVISVMDTSKA